jgi:restriction system protein
VARRSSWAALIRAQDAEARRRQAEALRAVRRAELDRIADEKERKRRYIEQRLEEVEDQNAQLDATVAGLSRILPDGLDRPGWPINFDSLKMPLAMPPFDAKGANLPQPAPKLDDFIPKPPGFMQRLVGGQKKYELNVQAAHKDFEEAAKRHAVSEMARELRLVQARREYVETCDQIGAEVKKHNEDVDVLHKEYLQGEPRAVAAYYSNVFDHDPLPEGFPTTIKTGYIAESKQLVIERELPTVDVVPGVVSYKYVRTGDHIESKARPINQRQSIYASVVAQLALRALHGAFAADSAGILESVVLNCFVDTIDAATGQPVSPYLLTVRTNKETLSGYDLRRVEPIQCLKALRAQVSRSPAELVPVRPLVDFNMVDKRFIESTDVLAGLDQRPNLMELSPGEFEGLITNLFTKMGLETRLTQASRDGGVDCVAWDMRPIVGGKVIVQAKRYKNTVGVSAVRDLYGTVLNEGAAKGILVTTSGYGKSAFEFIEHKPLELVTGSNLLYLLEEHTGVKARIEVPQDWVDPQTDQLGDEPPVDVEIAPKAIQSAAISEIPTTA